MSRKNTNIAGREMPATVWLWKENGQNNDTAATVWLWKKNGQNYDTAKRAFDLNFKAKKTKNKKGQPDYRWLRKER